MVQVLCSPFTSKKKIRLHSSLFFSFFRIIESTDYITIDKGQNAELMCKIDANPINTDTVKFTREGFDFESRTKVTTISGRNFYLTVYNVTEADAGKFTCEVNNGVGETVSNSSFLLVRRKYISVFSTM